MELMATCFDKLLKRTKEAVPEEIVGKIAVATVNALHFVKENHGECAPAGRVRRSCTSH